MIHNARSSRAGGTVDARLAVTGYGNIRRNTVFTVNADLAVLAVFTGSGNRFGLKVFAEFHINCAIAVTVLRDFRNDIRVIPFNGYFGAQFICFYAAIVSVKFQAFIS